MSDPFRKEITQNGTTYIFRYPTAMDMIRIENKAKELRGNNDGLGMAFAMSQAIAMLSQLCVEPKDTDFGSMPFFVTDKLYSEVAAWVNSFLRDEGNGQETTGDQEGQ